MKIFLIAFLLTVAIASAQEATYSLSAGPVGQIHFFATNTVHSIPFEQQVIVDLTSQTILFADTRFTIPAFTLDRIQTFDVGSGQTASYSTTLTVNAATVEIHELSGAHFLSPNLNDTFAIFNGSGYNPPAQSMSVTGVFSGTYSIVGPNGTYSGGFTTSGIIDNYDFPDNVDPAQYPDLLVISGTNDYTISFPNGDMFSMLIDGRLIGGDLRNLTMTTGSESRVFSPGALATVPEPATSALALASFGLLVAASVRARSRKQARN